ncbi:MAG: glycosyltransferase family 4 protein [Tepidisphaerales bacterium]
MVSVLHLLPVDADFQTARSVELLGRHLGADYRVEVRTIGRAGTYRNEIAAAFALRPARDFDIVHAWGITPFTAAALVCRANLVFSPTDPLTGRQVRWLRAASGYREFNCVVPSATLNRSLVERGLPNDRVHLIRPGVDFSRVKRRRNDELRAQLNLASDDFVLLAPGQSTRGANHVDALWATAILHHLDPRYKLLLWGQGPDLDRVIRFRQRMANADCLRVAQPLVGRTLDFEDLLPATDMVVISATGLTQTLPVVIAMAAGLPIASTVTYSISELLEDHHTALMTRPGSPQTLARRILELREDARLQWQLADTARTEAYEYHALTRFIDQHRALYTRL